MNDRYLVMTRLRSSMNDRYLVMTRLQTIIKPKYEMFMKYEKNIKKSNGFHRCSFNYYSSEFPTSLSLTYLN
ncbi:Uncharacterised protein [Streptococcus pneumoniae]|nr:Uncharacterised protein [Streptococcus pneumoniae]CIV99634.1 Uncharacterised protein [Streptococcus pneumoniae]